MKNETLLVKRNDFTDVTYASLDMEDLQAGRIRVQIGPFALTANNVTYMVTGDLLGYWKYFDPQAYGFGDDGLGRMPVWGYGIVTESRCDGLAVGTRIYGFFPIAKFIDMEPAKLRPQGFTDARAHRAALHGLYNSYSITQADPSFGAFEDLQPVLRPLFTTSFLIDDFFAEKEVFGAEQIIVLSASSKTALGTAFCLSKRGGVKVTGLTSTGNMEFVKATGFYDKVQSYDAITDLNPDVKTAIIDMAGNGAVTRTLYDHFEENIVYNCMVGKSHWQGESPFTPTKGAPMVMFFAPDQAKQRLSEWGGADFAQRLGARWMPFCDSAQHWLTVDQRKDVGAVLEVYKDLLSGQVDPAKSTLFTL